jgi:hypothetical protein
MHRNSFIACILTLACFFVLIPSLGTAQSDKVKTSMAALEAAVLGEHLSDPGRVLRLRTILIAWSLLVGIS